MTGPSMQMVDLLYSISRCPTPEAYEHAVINHVTIRRALPGYGCPYSMVAPWLERYPRNRFLFFLNSRLRGREIDHLLDLLDFLGLGASAKQWVERVNLTQLVLQSNNHVSNRLPMLQKHTRLSRVCPLHVLCIDAAHAGPKAAPRLRGAQRGTAHAHQRDARAASHWFPLRHSDAVLCIS